MTTSVENRLGGLLVALVDRMRRRARLVVAAICVATVGVAAYTANHLGVDADITSMIAPDLRWQINREEFGRLFPLLHDILLVVVDAETPEGASDAATALAERCSAETELFSGVYIPGAGPFFERNALLYLDTDQLYELADQLAEAQPHLAELSRDPSLRGLFALLARAVDATRSDELVDLDPTPVFDRLSAALEALSQEPGETMSWDELVLGDTSLQDESRRMIMIKPVLDFSDLQPARAAVERIRSLAAELELPVEEHVRFRLTGDFALNFEEMALVRQQAGEAGALSFVLVGVLLTAALRSARLIFAVLATLIVGLIWSLGFAAVSIGHLNPVSVAFAVLFIGLGVDFGIHVCMRYRELLGRDVSRAEALRETARGVGGSLVLCAVTTAIGFYAFVPTEYRGVAELGLIAGTGMFISLFLSLTLLPALLSLGGPLKRAPSERALAGNDRLEPRFQRRHPWVVRSLAALAALGAGVLLPEVRFDQNPLRVRDPSAESVRAFEDLLASSRLSPWSMNVLAPDRASVASIAAAIEDLEVVERTITLGDYVPDDQEEKLGILGEITLFLGPVLSGPAVEAPSVDEQLAALKKLGTELEDFDAEGVEPRRARSIERLRRALGATEQRLLASSEPEREVRQLEHALLGPLERRIEALRASLRAEPVSIEDLPQGLVDRMTALDGRPRIEVFASEDLNDNAAMARFADGVRVVSPDATGSAVNILESARAVVSALEQALVTAVVLISSVLWVLWRRLDDTITVLATLGLAALLTGAASVLLDVPLNFADVIVLPLLLGIGVDSSIHLVHRHRTERSAAGALRHTSTPRAVFYSALTTIASFGTLGLSTHRGLRSLGQLLTIGITLTLICNLFVLPTLIRQRGRR